MKRLDTGCVWTLAVILILCHSRESGNPVPEALSPRDPSRPAADELRDLGVDSRFRGNDRYGQMTPVPLAAVIFSALNRMVQ